MFSDNPEITFDPLLFLISHDQGFSENGPQPAAPATSKNLSKMQILTPLVRPNQQLWREDPAICVLTSSSTEVSELFHMI